MNKSLAFTIAVKLEKKGHSPKPSPARAIELSGMVSVYGECVRVRKGRTLARYRTWAGAKLSHDSVQRCRSNKAKPPALDDKCAGPTRSRFLETRRSVVQLGIAGAWHSPAGSQSYPLRRPLCPIKIAKINTACVFLDDVHLPKAPRLGIGRLWAEGSVPTRTEEAD